MLADKINSKTQEILTKYWDGVVPIDPFVIASKMGISVMSESCSDCIGKSYQANKKPVIEYDKMEPLVRQRFAIAHGLGHHALNHTENGRRFHDNINSYSINASDMEEIQANRFAIELLVPEIAIKHFVFKQKINSLTRLAELFLVSPVTIKYRLSAFGIL